MSNGTRRHQRGAVLLGLAGGLLVVAGGFAATFYVTSTRSEARAATRSAVPAHEAKSTPAAAGKAGAALEALGARTVELETGMGLAKATWAELGLEVDQAEVARAGATDTDAQLAALGAKGEIPVRIDRNKAAKALIKLKAHYDKSPVDAYLDLEARKIHDDAPGQGIDVWGSLPLLETAARQGLAKVDLASVPMPAMVSKPDLGISDISHVLGHFMTKFSIGDRVRNFNLKLAASKINGTVLQPHQEWSFNEQVGERSEKEGYKVAHVITKGEMVDGLAGGTCQISTTLYGASFFAGLDIVKTTPHSRPSTYTPFGFDATVVWPNTDLKLRNPYDFPVVIHYRVAAGEAVVEILGEKRPYSRVEFTREILEETPYPTEERLDDTMPEGATTTDQPGFDGFKLDRFRKFYRGRKLVKKEKWTVTYKPVTEYVRRGTNPDPNAQMPDEKKHHSLKAPKKDKWSMSQ